MKNLLVRSFGVVFLFVIVGTGMIWMIPGMAQAALGNQGIPARCYNIGFTSSFFLTCVTPSGSPVSFVSSQRVPDGYYFLITDIVVTPTSGVSGNVVDFNLEDAYGASSIQSINHFRTLDGNTFGQHYTAPMWVLLPDHRLGVVAQAANQLNFDIRVNGFLVTNINYLPLILNQ